MAKIKKEMMRKLYQQRKDAGLVRISFWVPKETKQAVTDAVERLVDAATVNKKRSFWK